MRETGEKKHIEQVLPWHVQSMAGGRLMMYNYE